MASLTNGWKLFSAAALTAAMLFTAVPAKAEAIPDGGTFTVTWAQNPVSLNPGLSSGISSGIPGAQLFASPLQYDDQWNPHPYLAEKWEMAPDGLSLTLHLVKGAKFHDGTPITSEDVAFSIMAIKANHPFKAMYAPVSGVDTPDPYTAVIRLSKPHPAILLCMSPVLCPIMPKHVYGTDSNIRQNPANKAPIGSGPFKFVEWKPGDYIMLEKNKDFFIKGKPHVERVIIKIIPDMNNRVMAVERGEVDAMPFFDSLREVKRLSGDKNLVVTNKGYAGIGSLDWVAFNTGKKPFDDVRVRQAAAYAIDRNFFAKVIMMGLVTPSATPITPFSPFYTKDVNMYDVNLEKAKKLLDEAGYPVKGDGTRFTVTVDYAPGSPTTKMMAEYLKPQLAKVGIDAKIRISPDFGTWAERVSNYNFDITTDNVFNWGEHREGRSFLQHPAVPQSQGRRDHGTGGLRGRQREAREAVQGIPADRHERRADLFHDHHRLPHHLQQACRQRARVHLGLPRSVYGRLPEEVAALDRAGRGNFARPGVLPDRGCSGRACLSILGMGPRPIRNIRGEFL